MTLKIYNILSEYFDLLKETKLWVQIDEVTDDYLVINKNLFFESSHPVVKTTRGWQPIPVFWAEQLFEDVFNFWSIKYQEIYNCIANLPGRYIHVEPGVIERSLRKYGCFFDGILVPDQLMLSREEHLGNRPLVDWRSFVLNSIRIIATYKKYENIILNNDNPTIIILPSRRIMEEVFTEHLSKAVHNLHCRFLSNLFGREINSPYEFIYNFKELGVNKMDQDLLNLVYFRDNAHNYDEYFKKYSKTVISEQGCPIISKDDPKELLLFIDVGARFIEFERSHSEAFLWGQEAEIPENDFPLFEWWLNESSKILTHCYSSSYSENDIYKVAVMSDKLSFLREIPLNDYIEFLKCDPVGTLREDFAVSRINIRNTKIGDLEKNIEYIGAYIEERLEHFNINIENLEYKLSSSIRRSVADIGLSFIFTVASVFYPPFSALSLLYGGNFYDLYRKRKVYKEKLDNELMRPIATLAYWYKNKR